MVFTSMNLELVIQENDNKHGQGTMTYDDGSCYVGEWKNGASTGNGKWIYADGLLAENIMGKAR